LRKAVLKEANLNNSVNNTPNEQLLLVRMLRVMFPHKNFSDGPYEEAAEAVINSANSTPGQALVLYNGLRELENSSFSTLDPVTATSYLKRIEKSPFFAVVQSSGLVALYNNHEVWKILGYEGPSFDLGGYINRGFNDLDWLPEPRITEYEEESDQ